MNMTRRSFLAGSTAFGGLALVSSAEMCTGGAPAPSTCCGKNKSRSLYNGIEVGCITYSYRSMRQKNAEDIVKYAVEDGLGTLELKGEVVDEYLKREGARDMGRLPALRKMFDDAGVSIHIVKYGGIGGKNVKEDEYRMAVAKALGAKCITREVPKVAEYETIGRRCAALADKHGVFIAFHLLAEPAHQLRHRPLRGGHHGRRQALHRSPRLHREVPREDLLHPPQGPHHEGERLEEP